MKAGFRRRRGAFTLMEALIATALLGGFLAASAAVLFQVSSAWATEAEDPVADRHAEGLERFLRRVFAESGAGGLTAPGANHIKDEGAFLAVRPPADLPPVEALAQSGGAIEGRLAAPPEGGLWLCWNTRNERSAGITASHRTLLSPWVVSANMYVLDTSSGRWLPVAPDSAVPGVGGVGASGAFRLIELKLVHRGRERTLRVVLPRDSQ